MTNTKGLKVSSTMEDALAYLGRGVHRAHLEPAARTIDALERRGLIEWANAAEVGATYDVTRLWNVTPAGWAWLKENLGMDRPADAGRATLEEALDLAYPHNADVDAVDAWITSRTEMDRERRLDAAVERAVDRSNADPEPFAIPDDLGRLTLEEALEYADGLRSAGWVTLYTARGTNWPTAKEYLAAQHAAVIAEAARLTDARDTAVREREQALSSQRVVEPKTDADRTPELNAAMAAQELFYRQAAAVQALESGAFDVSEAVQRDAIKRAAERNPDWDDHLPLLPRRTPGTALAAAVELVRRLEQTTHALTLHQALGEAYTPTGQPTCKHGRGVDDTCDGCTEDREMLDRTGDAWRASVGRQRGAGVWPEDGRAAAVEHNASGQVASYRGVPVPADVAETWDSYGAVSWARGVEAAQRTTGQFVCPVCHWPFQDARSAENHFAGHLRNGAGRG